MDRNAKEKLNIVHTESSCGWGGQEIRTLTEAKGMLERGHTVTLLCPEEAEIYGAAIKRDIPVQALPIARKNLRGMFAMRQWIRRHPEIDIINTHSSTDSWLTALACATFRNAPPAVRTRHVSSPVKLGTPTFWLYQKAARHIATTGESLRNQLHRDNGFTLESMTSVPTGIDLTWFKPLPKTACRQELGLTDRPIIGILGTLRNWKGHVYLLEALAQLHPHYPEWQLLVIGDGPQRHNLEKLVAQLNLGSVVRFVGNQEDVPTWLNCLDIFVLPSYGEEGVPQSIMQAMACGLPVISTPVGAIREAVVENTTGLIVPPRDSAALADALQRLIENSTLRCALGQAGRQRALACFGLDIMLDKMETIFYAHKRVRTE